MKVKVRWTDEYMCAPRGLLKRTPWVRGKTKKIKAFVCSEWVEDLDKIDYGSIWWCRRCDCTIWITGSFPREYKFCPKCNAKMY